MNGQRPVLLIMAKAPVPGEVKTRLVPAFTPHQAAALAAAALLDTLDACRTAAARACAEVVVALSGDLNRAMAADALSGALGRVRVIPQRGDGLAQRLAFAHTDAAGDFGNCLQLGMDTPHVAPDTLADGLVRISSLPGPDALLGPAVDGGWWALALRRAGTARCLTRVAMSTSHTGDDTLAALRADRHRVDLMPLLRDVDTVDDLEQVAATSDGRFGALARALHRWPREAS